jgi:hypothetical protein
MTTIQEYFRNTSKILSDMYIRSSEVKNTSSKGQDREQFIKDFLEKCFPKKFVIGSGEVIDFTDAKSRQADIIIYDEFMPILDYGSTKHFLSEGVLAHIEVKSNLTPEQLLKALEITKSMKNLKRDIETAAHIGEMRKSIFSCSFAYDGISKEKFKETIVEYYKNGEPIENRIDAVCVLNKYVMMNAFDLSDNKLKVGFFETKEDSLLYFFIILCEGIKKNWISVPSIMKYLGNPIVSAF